METKDRLGAHGPFSPFNRRALLKAAPAIAILPAVAAVPALASAETPVMRLFREWQPLAAWLNGPEGDAAPEADFNRVNLARLALEDRMVAEPARNAEDVLIKIATYTHFGEGEVPPQVWPEVRALIGGVA